MSFHFGLPPIAWMRQLQEAGVTLMATATTLREATLVKDAGVDFIVAQGVEAGGHRGVLIRTTKAKASRPWRWCGC